MITLTKSMKSFRPLILNGKQLENIIFYKDNNIIYESNRGWLEDNRTDVTALTINDPVKANKINLSRTDNFYLNNKEPHKTGYDLYIYIDNKTVKLSAPKEIIGCQSKTETRYQNEYILNIDCMVQAHKLNSMNELEYFDKPKAEITIHSRYIRTVKTDYGNQIDTLYSQFQNLNIDISTYDTELLFYNFNVSLKTDRKRDNENYETDK